MADVYDAHRLVLKRLKLVLEVLSRHHGANCITLLVAMSMGKMKKKFRTRIRSPETRPKRCSENAYFPMISMTRA